MKIGIYGGSFNPVHFGHVGLAKWVVEHTDLDEVWLMVSPNNPLKNTDELAPEQERLAGVRSAIAHIPGLVASDFEFTLPRPSYTANTLRQLTRTYPQHQFTLIIGEDNWDIFTQWREYDYILAHFSVMVYPRLYRRRTDGRPTVEKDIIYLSEAPYFDISSTEIRKKLSK
ncbi:MAG: nicotinate-nucleotide adenylyltransferase [Paludibacteraceae bacterium]|nr:nicotinate-nucleotide adenylyltransferase [Paludibacteraceae bacterium]